MKKLIANLPDMVAEARKLGYTHVLTYGGPVPLSEWKPYSHTIPPFEFELVENELRERNPNDMSRWTVTGSWPLIKGKLLCKLCGKQIRRGAWTKRVGRDAAHGRCV